MINAANVAMFLVEWQRRKSAQDRRDLQASPAPPEAPLLNDDDAATIPVGTGLPPIDPRQMFQQMTGMEPPSGAAAPDPPGFPSEFEDEPSDGFGVEEDDDGMPMPEAPIREL